MKKFFQNIGRKIGMLTVVALFLASISPAFFAVHEIYFSENTYTQQAFANPEQAAAQAEAEGNGSITQGITAAKDIAATSSDEILEGSNELKKKIATFASIFVSIFTPIIAILAKVIGSLLGDEFLMGSNSVDGGAPIAQLLYELWLIFRDIMNYLFIIILLVIAFMNIISPLSNGSSDSYALKTILPKLILAIVVINMTWFAARVVFDAVDITTRIVFALPQSIIEHQSDLNKECKVQNGKIEGLCNPEFISLDFLGAVSSKKKELEEIDDQISAENINLNFSDFDNADSLEAEIEAIEEAIEEASSEELTMMTLELIQEKMGKTDPNSAKYKALEEKYEMIDGQGIQGATNMGGVVIHWTDFNYHRFNEGNIAPLFAFTILQVQNLPKVVESSIKGQETGWDAMLINTIMALVLMIIILVLFLMMAINLFFRIIILWINIILSPFMGLMMFKSELKLDSVSGDTSEYIGLAAFLKHAFAPVIMGLPMVIGFIMIVVARQKDIMLDADTVLQTPLTDNLSNIHQIFFYMLTIAVLWVGGVKAIEATSAGFVKDALITPIKNGVEGAAKFIAKSPMYITFLPVNNGGSDKGEPLSFKNLLDAPSEIANRVSSEDSSRLTNLMNPGGREHQKSLINQNTHVGQIVQSMGKNNANTYLTELRQAKNDKSKIETVLDKIDSTSQLKTGVRDGSIQISTLVKALQEEAGRTGEHSNAATKNLIREANKPFSNQGNSETEKQKSQSYTDSSAYVLKRESISKDDNTGNIKVNLTGQGNNKDSDITFTKDGNGNYTTETISSDKINEIMSNKGLLLEKAFGDAEKDTYKIEENDGKITITKTQSAQ